MAAHTARPMQKQIRIRKRQQNRYLQKRQKQAEDTHWDTEHNEGKQHTILLQLGTYSHAGKLALQDREVCQAEPSPSHLLTMARRKYSRWTNLIHPFLICHRSMGGEWRWTWEEDQSCAVQERPFIHGGTLSEAAGTRHTTVQTQSVTFLHTAARHALWHRSVQEGKLLCDLGAI